MMELLGPFQSHLDNRKQLMGVAVTKSQKILVQRLVANILWEVRLEISLVWKWESHNL